MKKSLVFIILLLTTACAQTSQSVGNVSPIQIVEKPIYPDLPPINLDDNLPLKEFTVDMPRDKSRLVVKNTEACKKVSEKDRNEKFWKNCGEHPVLTDSNIFVGFDVENWNILMYNLKLLQEKLNYYRKIIEEINLQRLEWKHKNSEN